MSVHFREFYREAGAEIEPLEWIGLLQSCTAFEAYCKAYTADLRPDRIAEFLVLNAVFPHSIRFSADALAASLKQIGREAAGRPAAQVERIAGRMQSTLEFGQMDEIMSGGLQGYLDTVRRQCAQVYFGGVSGVCELSGGGGVGSGLRGLKKCGLKKGRKKCRFKKGDRPLCPLKWC